MRSDGKPGRAKDVMVELDVRHANDCGDDFVQVCQPLDRIGEGLLIDLRVLRPDPVTDGAVGNSSKFENS